jgi:lipopolysaccharide transport system permease protein
MDAEVVITPDRGLEQPLVARVRSSGPLLRLWTARELRARYRQSVLRAGWSIIQPVALMGTYGWVLTAVLDVQQEPIPYLTFAWSGLVGYLFLQQALGLGVGSIVDAGHIVSKVYFPREVLPLAVVGVSLVDLAVTMVILFVLAVIQVGAPSIHAIAVVVPLLVLVVAIAAATVACAAITVFRRDLRHAMPLILRMAFILSPVMYSVQQFGPRARWIVELNTLTVCIEAIRDTVLRGAWPQWHLLAAHGAVAAVLLVVTIAGVSRIERRMSDQV